MASTAPTIALSAARGIMRQAGPPWSPTRRLTMRNFLTALSVSVVLGAAPAVMAGELDADGRNGGGGCSYGHDTVKNDFETPPPAASAVKAVKPKPQG